MSERTIDLRSTVADSSRVSCGCDRKESTQAPPKVETFQPIRILFAPDWREGVAYQDLLARELAQLGTEVVFASGYRRVLPLARITHQFRPDVLHLHWPEAYAFRRNRFDAVRIRRLSIDVRLAALTAPLVLTAHNLFPHNVDPRGALGRAITSVHRMASAVIAHSHEAARVVCETHGVDPRRVFMIPHGDLSSAHGNELPDRRGARQSLALPDRPICLMFGRVEPYKGIDEIVDFWNTEQPGAELCIVGFNDGDLYGKDLLKRIGGNPSIRTIFRHVPDTELALWLAAADCVMFNYRALLTSGAAPVARSFGVPLLLPSRLSTVDLGEPNPRVFRFDDVSKLKILLPEALAIGSDYSSAEPWRRACAWNVTAEKTRGVYEHVLRGT